MQSAARILGLGIAIALACAGAPAPDQRSMVTADQRTRTWLEHAPPSGAPRPLLLALHGGGGNAGQFRAHSTLDAVGDRLGAIVVHADGTPGGPISALLRWDAGECCATEPVDDVGFLVALVEDVRSRSPVDRVVLVGHSNGAMMAERALCERPDVFGAAVLVGSPGAKCTPREPRPVVVVHGEQDRCATLGPAEMCGGCWQRALGTSLRPATSLSCEGAAAIASRWRSAAGSVGEATPTPVGGARCERWADGRAPVALCLYDGGHVFPSGAPTCPSSRPACAAILEATGPAPTAPVDLAALIEPLLR